VWTVAGYEQQALSRQLEARQPDLFVLFYGTNESGLSKFNAQEMALRYDTLFATLRRSSPEAECLIIGPTDRMMKRGVEWIEAISEDKVMAAVRNVARTHGCAFWDARAAMGGPASIETWIWNSPPLANYDHVHLTPRGYRALAQAFVDDLLATYGKTLAASTD
jgi:lysophospholipase L1-like esterase